MTKRTSAGGAGRELAVAATSCSSESLRSCAELLKTACELRSWLRSKEECRALKKPRLPRQRDEMHETRQCETQVILRLVWSLLRLRSVLRPVPEP